MIQNKERISAQGELFPVSLSDNADEGIKGRDEQGRLIQLAGGAELVLVKGWIGKEKADVFLQHLTQELPWQQPQIKVYGKLHRIPRKQSWHGDSDAVMLYSKTRFLPNAWHPYLQLIRRDLEQQYFIKLNSVLANLYRDGGDGMGWHADDEPELGVDPVIASISLGAQRMFVLKPKKNLAPMLQKTLLDSEQCDKEAMLASCRLSLGHGDLLIMRGKTQRFWQHAVPKTKKVTAARLNLTYRFVFGN